MDPILLKGMERIIIAAGAIFFAYLGYRLYRVGVEKRIGQLNGEPNFAEFVLSGAGPGLFFMLFGAILLTVVLFTGKASQIKLADKVPIVQKDNIRPTIQTLEKSLDKNERSIEDQLEENFEKMRIIQEQILNKKESKDLSKEEEQNLLSELSELRREKRRLRYKLKHMNVE